MQIMPQELFINCSLNGLKTIKRKLDNDSVEKYNEKYNEIVDKTERRNDTDFFRRSNSYAKNIKSVG